MPKYSGIKAEDGVLLTREKDILKHWKAYYEQLMSHEGTQNENHAIQIALHVDNEPDIMREEAVAAVKKQKCYKSTGIDDVTVEMILAADEIGN